MTDAANSVPPGRQSDVMLMQIANKGLAELSGVVRKANANSNTIGEKLRRLQPGFDAIRLSQKFGNDGNGVDQPQSLQGEVEPGEKGRRSTACTHGRPPCPTPKECGQKTQATVTDVPPTR